MAYHLPKADAEVFAASYALLRVGYMSNTLMVWLRLLRITRIVFVVIPIVFGALANWEILKGNNRYEYLTATMALVYGDCRRD